MPCLAIELPVGEVTQAKEFGGVRLRAARENRKQGDRGQASIASTC
jgi:hypothetical protein